MRFRATAMTCAALAAAGLVLAPAAHASSRPVQVNGNKLANALLSPSAFGSDYQRTLWASTGRRLLHQRAKDHVASMSCGSFENINGFGRFGQSAAALSYAGNPNPWPDYPNTEFYYAQYVDQFASAKAAISFYNQAHAKYVKCQDFTESVPADSVPGSGAIETTTQSVSAASVGKYRAFAVGQSADLSEMPGVTLMLNTLVAVEGTDVFTMVSGGGTNDQVPPALMLKLINRVKKLR